MNYPLLFFVSSCLLLLIKPGICQSVEEDMLKLQQAYENGRIIQRLSYLPERQTGEQLTEDKIISKNLGWSITERRSSFTYLDGVTIIKNDSLTLMVDDKSRTLMVFSSHGRAASTPLEKIKTAINLADSIKPLTNLAEGLRGYRFWLRKEEEVVVDIIFLGSTYLVRSISTTYPKGKGSGINLTVEFEVKELPEELKGKNKLSMYIVWDNGDIAPAPAFAEYDFINGLGE